MIRMAVVLDASLIHGGSVELQRREIAPEGCCEFALRVKPLPGDEGFNAHRQSAGPQNPERPPASR